jgi:cobalt-zinc-cadmium resistance protein CzcA
MSVAKAYCNLNFAENSIRVLQRQDSVYQDFVKRANVRYASGESNILELMNAQNKTEENRLQLSQAKIYLANCQAAMQGLLNSSEKILTAETQSLKLPEINILSIDTQNILQNPLVSYYGQQIRVKSLQINVEKNRLLPNIF